MCRRREIERVRVWSLKDVVEEDDSTVRLGGGFIWREEGVAVTAAGW